MNTKKTIDSVVKPLTVAVAIGTITGIGLFLYGAGKEYGKTVGKTPQAIIQEVEQKEAEQQYRSTLGKKKSDTEVLEEQNKVRESQARRRLRAETVARDFLAFVDRNDDHYLAPEEIMNALRRCGYSGWYGHGDLEMYVWSWQDEDVTVRNASQFFQATAYRVSTDFAEHCVKQEQK